MCARLDQNRLLCFPQREQAAIYIVPDTYQGKPLPMTLALSNKSGVATLTDYRGHRVLAAYAPVANTGLGLVLRKDLSEIYAPIRGSLLIALPLIFFLVTLGLWLIRNRVRPLIVNITTTYIAEKESREHFDAAMKASPDGFVIYESMKNQNGEIIDFRCVYLNAQVVLMSGYTRKITAELLGKGYLEIFPDRVDLFEKFKAVVLTGELLVEEISSANSGGGTHWFIRQAVPMAQGLAITYRDITKEKMLVLQLELSNQLRSAIVESAAYSIISTAVDGTILSFNKAAERMLWYQADEMIGKSTPAVFHDADEVKERADTLSHELGFIVEPGFEVFVAKARMNSVEEREWTYVRKDGSRFPVLLSVTALYNENNTLNGYLGIAYDISERKRAEEYIRHIALHDVLTGLPNRALLDDRVMMAIEQQRRCNTEFALAMMDIDHFKHINDAMGHHIGDRLLKEFVERVKLCLRPTDTLARMGGDEFVMLMLGIDEAGVKIVVERIMQTLLPPINVEIQEVHITSSIGISICPRDGDNLHELLRCADVAMYWVKENGRNGYMVYNRDLDRRGTERLKLERDLHSALDHKGFTLFYQPKVDLKTNTVIGMEALLRMPRKDGQYASPADFIPLAEETGLIVPIGQWVLDTACRDTATMQQQLGAVIKVAVNISPRQFMNGDLVNTIKNALEQSNLDASHLEVEITEGVLMDERSGVTTALFELHELGVSIAIDDFGTGYSSLSYLKRYPIDTLKIDQSFVRDINSDSGDAALVVAMLAMGKSLGIDVVAEGIETDVQLAFLAANNCDLGQGYLIAHPMPLEVFFQWMNEKNRWKLDKAST